MQRASILAGLSDEELKNELDSLDADDIRNELENYLGEDVINAFIDKFDRFVAEHNANGELNFDGYDDDQLDWYRVQNALEEEFSASTPTKVGGSLMASIGGAVSLASGGVLVASTCKTGLLLLATVAPYTLAIAAPFALLGLGILLGTYLYRRHKERDLGTVSVENAPKFDVIAAGGKSRE